MRGTKVLFIGLDAAGPLLIRKWGREGLLPNLQSFIDQGISGPMRGPRGMGDGAFWPSPFTGVNPARHTGAQGKGVRRF